MKDYIYYKDASNDVWRFYPEDGDPNIRGKNPDACTDQYGACYVQGNWKSFTPHFYGPYIEITKAEAFIEIL